MSLQNKLPNIIVFQGDSGGPMTVEDASTKQHTLVGVVSWGEECAKVNYL
mgnify:CR=1 FL=1